MPRFLQDLERSCKNLARSAINILLAVCQSWVGINVKHYILFYLFVSQCYVYYAKIAIFKNVIKPSTNHPKVGMISNKICAFHWHYSNAMSYIYICYNVSNTWLFLYN